MMRMKTHVILSVTLLTVVSSHPLGGTEAVSSPVITQSSLAVTLALAAIPPIDRVSVVSRTAAVTVLTLSVMLAGLLTFSRASKAALTVSVTLTGGTGGEVPLLVLL